MQTQNKLFSFIEVGGVLLVIWTLARSGLIMRCRENETLKDDSPNGTAGVVLTKGRQIYVVSSFSDKGCIMAQQSNGCA